MSLSIFVQELQDETLTAGNPTNMKPICTICHLLVNLHKFGRKILRPHHKYWVFFVPSLWACSLQFNTTKTQLCICRQTTKCFRTVLIKHVSHYSSEPDTTMRSENTLHVGSCLRKISYFDPCVLPAGDYGATRGPSTCLQWWLTSFECRASSLETRSSDKETSSSFRLAAIGCRLTISRACELWPRPTCGTFIF